MPCGISQYSVNDLGGAKPYHYVNRRGREIYGVGEAEEKYASYARIHPDDRGKYIDMLNRVVEGGSRVRMSSASSAMTVRFSGSAASSSG